MVFTTSEDNSHVKCCFHLNFGICRFVAWCHLATNLETIHRNLKYNSVVASVSIFDAHFVSRLVLSAPDFPTGYKMCKVYPYQESQYPKYIFVYAKILLLNNQYLQKKIIEYITFYNNK
jgi:hypothetical protein